MTLQNRRLQRDLNSLDSIKKDISDEVAGRALMSEDPKLMDIIRIADIEFDNAFHNMTEKLKRLDALLEGVAPDLDTSTWDVNKPKE